MLNLDKCVGIKITVLSILLSGSLLHNAQASSLHFNSPSTNLTNSASAPMFVNFGVNDHDVQFVATPSGRFYNAGNGNWKEVGNDGGQFSFREMGRDDWSVYLRDDSRGVNIQLDIHTREVKYSDDTGQSFVLYQIIDANNANQSGDSNTQIGNAYSSSVVEYTCNEGIPLILTFENEGNDSWVSWSHDGFHGPNRLPSVISGSGSKYSDGRNTVWEKGGQVYLNLNGIEDNCSQL